MSNLVKFIDIEKDIERRKSLIQNEIDKSGLTKKQLENGWKLRQMEDLAFDDNEKMIILRGVCEVLEYDYEKVIDIQRDVEIIDIFEEILDDAGFCIMIDHVERPNEYYVFETETTNYGKNRTIYAHRWNEIDRKIEDLEYDQIPKYILKDDSVQKEIKRIWNLEVGQ